MSRATKSYQESEMLCKCGHCPKDFPSMASIILMEYIHKMIEDVYTINPKNVRVVVTSWVRCWLHNKRVGGAGESRHQMQFGGDAADFKVYVQFGRKSKYGVYQWIKIDPEFINDRLDEAFPNSLGLGLYVNRNHADCREIKARWEVK